jgi:predicted phosphodiesterase
LRALRVGLISDTHGLLRPEARAFLIGCDYILHGGDIGGQEILDELALIAPVIAVRGNNDTEAWAQALAEVELVIRTNRRSRSAGGFSMSIPAAAGRAVSICRSAWANSASRAMR